jgi:hypothetical protein
LADNVEITSGTGTSIAADEISSVKHQRVKVEWGVDGVAVDTSASNPLPVVQTGTPALPTGAASAANQATEITSLASIDTKLTDVATQTTLALLNAKVPASPATAGNQSTANTSLASILAKLSADPSTETTLAAILAKIIAAPATSAKQDALAALIGEVQVSPTTNTLLERLKAIQTALAGSLAVTGTLTAVTTVGTITNVVHVDDNAGSITVDGTFWQATQPVSLATLPALVAGTAAIGKLAANDGVDIGDVTINNATGASAVNIQDGGNSITVDGSLTTVSTVSTITNVVHVDDNSSTISVDDGAGSLTVDGTVAATQSGTWTVQPGNTANTTAWKVDGSAVTQPVSGTVAISGSVAVTGAGGGQQYAEDAAHVSADLGTMALTVRKDTAAATSGTDGDYQPLITDASGRLHTIMAPLNVAPTLTSVAANNTDMLAATDVSNYRSGSLSLTGTWSAQVSVQASNDGGTTWASLRLLNTGAGGSITSTANNTSSTYMFTLPAGSQLRIRTTVYSSGTVAGTLQLSSVFSQSSEMVAMIATSASVFLPVLIGGGRSVAASVGVDYIRATDYATLQAAADAAGLIPSKRLYIPAGIYADQIASAADDWIYSGMGPEKTIIQLPDAPTSTVYGIRLLGKRQSVSGLSIKGGALGTANVYGISCRSAVLSGIFPTSAYRVSTALGSAGGSASTSISRARRRADTAMAWPSAGRERQPECDGLCGERAEATRFAIARRCPMWQHGTATWLLCPIWL